MTRRSSRHFSAILLVPVFLLAAAVQNASATGLVMIKKGDTIAIAVDSREVSGERTLVSDNVCKIGHAGTYLWAATGLSSDKKSGYDVRKLVAGAAVNRNSLAEIVAKFDDIAAAMFTKLLGTGRERMRGVALSGEEPILNVVFVGAENGQLEWHFHRFRCVQGGTSCTVGVTRDDCPGNGCGSAFVKMAGPASAREVGQYLKSNMNFLASQTPANAARILLGEMMHYAPDVIGGSMEVVELTPSDIVWVDDPLGCNGQ